MIREAIVAVYLSSRALVAAPPDRDLAETIESDPLCITDLFQNKSVAYY